MNTFTPPRVILISSENCARAMGARVVRSLSFPFEEMPAPLRWLLEEFRLLVNKSIRIALRDDIRSRFRLARIAYRTLSAEHDVYKQYIPSAFEVALATLKAYRRRVRRGRKTDVPYLRRLMLKAENQSYRLDPETRRLRLPIRAGQQAFLDLPLSDWHRSLLGDASWSLGSLTVTPDRGILTVRKATPEPRSE